MRDAGAHGGGEEGEGGGRRRGSIGPMRGSCGAARWLLSIAPISSPWAPCPSGSLGCAEGGRSQQVPEGLARLGRRREDIRVIGELLLAKQTAHRLGLGRLFAVVSLEAVAALLGTLCLKAVCKPSPFSYSCPSVQTVQPHNRPSYPYRRTRMQGHLCFKSRVICAPLDAC
jgi:hypothetical protein